MKKLLLPLLFFLVLISCKKDDTQRSELEEEFSFKVDTEQKMSSNALAILYKVGTVELWTEGDLILYIEELKEDSFPLNKNSFSEGLYKYLEARPYSTNSMEENSGYIKITEVDRSNERISGEFEFELKNIEDDSVSISQGKFEGIKYEEVDPLTTWTSVEGRVRAIINGEQIRYREVSVREDSLEVHIRMEHPFSTLVTLSIPKRLNEGEYRITSSNSLGEDELYFSYKKDIFSGFTQNIPEENCKLQISLIDLENKVFYGNLEGTFKGIDNLSVEIEEFQIELNWY